MRRIAAALLAVAATAAGCAQAGGDDTAQPSPWGSTYTATAVTEQGAPKRLADGTRIELRFMRDGRLIATAGCNQLSGKARIDEARLRVDELASTEMGCDPARHEQDRWLAGFLQRGPGWRLAGDRLTLDAEGTTLDLVAGTPRPLAGPRWVVDTLVKGEIAGSLPAGVEAWLTFTADGKVSGSDGCNQLGGAYTAEGSTIRFTDLVTTKMACQDERASVESAVLQVLRGEVRSAIDGDHLTLTAPDGTGLRLRAA
ncbi:META domain-containing protein [Dactylosporangium sp. AC04546]|uniref:META domain-containing protein n=1 Tax=Dactylosporangium sp. AC04546 TaxID=2862460 RepID=UPI001EDFC6F7|nr:META domain-containing protein [Dactylosporangium sp. AC04546]WVK80168.1 META domain-containing protein [Dactylosporangium sp. AC04546]